MKKGNVAFGNCRNLTEVVIPENTSYIGMNAFRDCSSLKSVTFINTIGWLVSEDNPIDVTDATCLLSTYADYVWKNN